jgi:hypothetical protein
MPERLTHQEYVAAQRSRAAQIARDAVAGRLSVLEAVRLIGSGYELELEGDDDLAALEVVHEIPRTCRSDLNGRTGFRRL